MIVNVTRRHINKGVKCDPWNCPVALAIKSVVKRGVKVSVALGFEFEYKGREYSRKWNKKVNAFVAAVDAGEEVEPVELSINIPKELLR